MHLYIPENVQTIGNYAFRGCTALGLVYYAGTKDTAMTIGTNIYDKTTILEVYGRLGTAAIADAKRRGIKHYLIDPFEWADLSIPYEVKVIEEEAFAGCRSDLMIYGYQETAAERYAAANGYYFALAPVG